MGYKLDLSEYQGNPNFPELAKIADFVTLRVQAGSSHMDTKYAAYAAACKANNLPFGTYAFGKFLNPADAEKEATDGFNRSDKESQFFAVDVETVCTTKPEDLVPSTQAFVNKLRALGVKKIGLYSGEYFYKQHGLDKVTGIDFLWLAKYPGGDNGTINQAAKPATPCDLWQYSSKIKVAAIPDNYVDGSELVGSKDVYFFTGKTPPAPQPAPTPAPAPIPSYATYTVKTGDTLWGIAKAHGVDVSILISLNKQYEKTLPIGATVKIPK